MDNTDDEIYASAQKVRFIQSQLPRIVGSTPFWMDTLTVNQRDPAEVIAVVEMIPTIFRQAQKTIAIREDDGFYPCCAALISNDDDCSSIRTKMIYHAREAHWKHDHSQSYLQRLWTLQECLLSHTLEFHSTYKGHLEELKGWIGENSINTAMDAQALDALFTLAFSFEPAQDTSADSVITTFIRAYIRGKTVCRIPRSPRSMEENIFSEHFVVLHAASSRAASKSRDYIFATMPQFPWYKYPRNALSMSFSEIFVDLYNQSAAAEHPFASRILASMTSSTNGVAGWLPSREQPEPKCLGDFLKLMGQPLPEYHVHGKFQVASYVTVVPMEGCDYPNSITLLEATIRFQPHFWRTSHINRELSKYGDDPERILRSHNDIELLRELKSSKALQLQFPELFSSINSSGGIPFDEHYVLRLSKLAQQVEGDRAKSDTWLTQQAMKFLNLLWIATDDVVVSEPGRGDWAALQREIRDSEVAWSERLQHFALLLAAMLVCQIPLSAAAWADEVFIPVRIFFKTTWVLGLLSKNAAHRLLCPGNQTSSLVCLARHNMFDPYVGTDLVLADPVSHGWVSSRFRCHSRQGCATCGQTK